MKKIQHISKISITVSNLDKVVPFYTEVLSFEEVKRYELSGKKIRKLFNSKKKKLPIQVAQLRLGDEFIELMEFKKTGHKIPLDSRSNDLWFQHIAIVVNDMKQAYQRLWKYKVKHVSTAPQTLPAYITAAAGVTAFYFQDPDGHNLELIQFPKGKGNPKWQTATDKLFLGIDHSAIAIDRTSTSLKLYKKILGLKIGGKSENYGQEQALLNQIFGARLLITGLVAKKGIGLEFLEYIAPPGGRKYPKKSDVDDLWHWHTSIKVRNIKQLYKTICESKYLVISDGIVTLNHTDLDAQKAFLVRDSDGHALFIYE